MVSFNNKRSISCAFFSVLLIIPLFSFMLEKKQDSITIFTIGDSTMANKNLQNDNQERGWAQMLGGFFSDRIEIDNHAQNGRSSKSFIDEGRWDKVLKKIKKGDYVFIQFGHNDEKKDVKRHTIPGSTFDENLKKFVNETRAKGGIPVLFNSIVRRNFFNPDQQNQPDSLQQQEGEILYDTHGGYVITPEKVAKELNVPFINANKITHDLVQSLGPDKSKNLFMWIAPESNLCHPKGLKDNTHLNVQGARIIAGLLVDEIKNKIPDLAQEVRYYDFVVAQDGSGDFFTVQEAINAVPDFRKQKRTTILIRKGNYYGKMIVPKSKINIALIGEEGTKLTYDDYASKENVFGEEKGTSGSASFYLFADDFYAENLIFENSAGPVGQAVACFIDGDRAYFKNCSFLGFQDTLYTYGMNVRQYFEGCYIEGTVDFIFGWSTALFNKCTIHSKKSNGYITAPSTPEHQEFGYVFHNCKLTGEKGVENVYLSRPWRPYAQAVFIQCELGEHIHPKGWHNWNKPEAERTVFYAEFENYGDGANFTDRSSFSHQLKELGRFELQNVLKGEDGWNPIIKENQLINTYR